MKIKQTKITKTLRKGRKLTIVHLKLIQSLFKNVRIIKETQFKTRKPTLDSCENRGYGGFSGLKGEDDKTKNLPEKRR